MRPGVVALFAVWAVGSLTGCVPTCDRACRAILDCELAGLEGYGQDRCAADCEDQQVVYDSLADDLDQPEGQEAFDALRTCVVDTTCDDLAAGACYDPTLWAW